MMKKLIQAMVATFLLSSVTGPTVQASGIPTVDIAGLTQQLIGYLQTLKQYEQDMTRTMAVIEQLRQLQIPTVSDLKYLSQMIARYEKLAENYNKTAEEYNTLNQAFTDLQEIEKAISNCRNGRRCSQEEVKEANAAKLKLISKLHTQMQNKAKFYDYLDYHNPSTFYGVTSEEKKRVQGLGSGASTSGELAAAQFEATKELTLQVIQMREDMARMRGEDLSFQYRRSQIDDAPYIQQLSKYADDSNKD